MNFFLQFDKKCFILLTAVGYYSEQLLITCNVNRTLCRESFDPLVDSHTGILII